MRLTNSLNLPEAIVKAVQNDPYSKGDADVSVTTLLKPMRAVALEKQFHAEISEDVAERLYSTYGQIVHHLLERANTDRGVVTERRLFMTVEGLKVSGAMDSFKEDEGALVDFKFTTVWKFKGSAVPPEWEQQQNCYAELLRHNGHKVTRLEVIGLMRDYSKLEAKRDALYPQLPVARMSIPLWSQEKAQAFLIERVKAYKEALKVLPDCSPEERWARQNVYAVMKDGRKSAVKLHDNAESAGAHACELGKGHFVVVRAGQNVRCESYCAAAPFCAQFQYLKNGGGLSD